MSDCVHASQVFKDGAWLCRSCGADIKSEPTKPCDYKSIRFGGLVALDQFRRLGQTERAMTADNIKRFRERKGYDPVPADDKGRWI